MLGSSNCAGLRLPACLGRLGVCKRGAALQVQCHAAAGSTPLAQHPILCLHSACAGERLSGGGGGFGSLRDAGSDPAAAMRRAHLDTIARDINRHAAVVLQGAPDGLPDLDGGSSTAADGSAPATKKGQDSETARIAQALAEQQKRAAAAAAGSSAAASGSGGGGDGKDDGVSPERLAEWQERAASALEDLTLDDREKHYAPLNIQDPRAYFDAAAAAGGAADGKPGAAKHEVAAAGAAVAAAAAGPAAALAAALAAVQPLALPDPPCDPALASEVLLELSQDQDEALVAEFGPVAATALQYPPHDRTHGLPTVLLVRGAAGGADSAARASGKVTCSVLTLCLELPSLALLRSNSQKPLSLSIQLLRPQHHRKIAVLTTSLCSQTRVAHNIAPVVHNIAPIAHPQEHLRGEALKTNELLRHLWGALPLVSAARADKAAALARHLGEQRALLRSHMEAHPGGHRLGLVSLLGCVRCGSAGGILQGAAARPGTLPPRPTGMPVQPTSSAPVAMHCRHSAAG